jgi:ABC-2 type transport system permease protein
MNDIKRMFALAFVNIKTVDMGISFGNKKNNLNKKGTSIAGIVILSFVFLYFGGIILFMSNTFYDFLAPLGLQAAMLGYASAMFSFLIFFFGIFYIISVFYFSSDIERLLALPFQAWEIIGGKFLSVVFFEYFTSSLVLIPYFTFGIKSNQGLLFFIYSIIVFLLLPIIPLAITAVIIMPIMRFVKFARNKDAFNMVAGVLVLFIALGFNFYMQSLGSGNLNNIGAVAQSGGEKLSELASMIFPGTFFAGKALTLSGDFMGFINLLVFILSTALAFGIVLILANYLYIKAATSVSSSSATHKKLSREGLSRSMLSAPAFITYMKKDIKILLRTPIFFLNNIIMNFLWPFFMLMVFFVKDDKPGSPDILAMIHSVDYSDSGMLSSILFIVFAGTIIIRGMNGIAPSALSREGSNFNVMKYIPMSYFTQVMAKIAVGYLFSLLGIICGFAVIYVVAMPPLWLVLLALLVAIPAALLPNITGIIYELLWPKLHWDNEQKAVKQNLNVVLGIFIPMGVAVPAILLGVMLKMDLFLAFPILFFGMLIIDAIIIFLLKHIIPLRMEKIVY